MLNATAAVAAVTELFFFDIFARFPNTLGYEGIYQHAKQVTGM